MTEGWICPVYGKGLAPWVPECDCTTKKIINTTEGTGLFSDNAEMLSERICGVCKFNDGCIYTSNPPQYKCTITGKFHFGGHTCDVTFE